MKYKMNTLLYCLIFLLVLLIMILRISYIFRYRSLEIPSYSCLKCDIEVPEEDSHVISNNRYCSKCYDILTKVNVTSPNSISQLQSPNTTQYQTSSKKPIKKVRFKDEPEVFGDIFQNKHDRKNHHYANDRRRNAQLARLVGGSKKLAHLTLSSIYV